MENVRMPVDDAIAETMEYRVILVLPDSRQILAVKRISGFALPCVCVPLWERPARQLQMAVQAVWGPYVLVLDIFPGRDGSPHCAVAEVLGCDAISALEPVAAAKITSSELSEEQRARLMSLLSGESHAPFSRLGWIDEAIAWIESVTEGGLSPKCGIVQYNAGGAFALLRFLARGPRSYWLKATGAPNRHEYSITSLLSKICGDYLPELIASKPSWNAWLTSGEATPVAKLSDDPQQLFRFLKDAVESMAKLQIRTEGHGRDLLDAGAFDQSMKLLSSRSEELFEYLDEAMNRQISTKVPRLERSRLQEIRMILEETCCRMMDLDFPETIVHGDINSGNILVGAGHCQFIDWSEAYLGNPLISLQHLLLLTKIESTGHREQHNRVLREKYRMVWLASGNPMPFDKAFAYMPLLAIVSTLYGRGDWLSSPQRYDARRQSYSRTLARYMDRAAREPELAEALCQ